MTVLQLFPYDLFDPQLFLAATGSSARTVAVEFVISSGQWWLTEIRLWRSNWELGGPLAFRLYSVTSPSVGVIVPGTDVTARVQSIGWQTAVLPAPVLLTAGQVYRACCRAPRGVQYQNGFFSTVATVNGVLTAPNRAGSVGTTQGAYTTSAALAFPTTDGAGTNWWVDVTITDVNPASETSPLADALALADQTPIVILAADWARDDYAHALAPLAGAVDEITVERSITGDLPVEAGLVEGYAAAQLTATLSGELADDTTEALAAFAPHRTDSPLTGLTLPGAPVYCELGLATDAGPVVARQFTGRVRSLRCDSDTRAVTLSALDPAERLRASITLPVYGMVREDSIYPARPQAVIDYILRANGIYASPPAFPAAQIVCTGHGWLAAEVGANILPNTGPATISDPPFWTPGPFDMLAVRGHWTLPLSQGFFARGQGYSPVAGNGIGVCMWARVGVGLGQTAANFGTLVRLDPMAGGSGPSLEVRIYGDGRLGAYVDTNGSIRTIPAPYEWRYIGVHFAHLAGSITRISFRVNGSTTTVDVATPAITGAGDVAPYLLATVKAVTDWSNLSVWFSPTAPATWTGEDHTSEASLDIGRNELFYLPDVTDRDSWGLIQDVVGAESGLAGFDEWGAFYFRERANSVVTAGALTVSADRELTGAVTTTDIDSLRNIVSARVFPFIPVYQTVFATDRVDQFDTVPGTTIYYVLLPWGVMGSGVNRTVLGRYAVASWNDASFDGYVAVDAANPGTELPGAVSLLKVWWSVLPGGRFGQLTVKNTSAYTARFAHPTTLQPALRISGYQLTATPTQTMSATDAASVTLHGARILTLPESTWRQLSTPTQVLVTALVSTLSSPREILTVTTTGDPRRRTGDTVIVSDPTGLGIITGLIVAITRRYSDQGLIDTLTVRSV
jgi:hypothetical protein